MFRIENDVISMIILFLSLFFNVHIKVYLIKPLFFMQSQSFYGRVGRAKENKHSGFDSFIISEQIKLFGH